MAKPTPFASTRRAAPMSRRAGWPLEPQRIRVTGEVAAVVELRGPRTRAPAQCERVLRSLPEWF